MATTRVSKMFVILLDYCVYKCLFFISTPENVYLGKNISILGGLEAEILTRVVCGLCRPFLKWPPLKSNIFFVS